MLISRTPLRLSLVGGGTDFEEFYREYSGATLGTTIDKYIYISINRPSNLFPYKYRLSYSMSEYANTVDEIKHPIIREVLKDKFDNSYLDVHIFSDLPASSGLGSSSAFTVGFLNGLYALEGKHKTKHELAHEAIRFERKILKQCGGHQDQYLTSFGGMNFIKFQEGTISVYPLVVSREKRELLEESVLLLYTGITRNSSEVLRPQVDNLSTSKTTPFLQQMLQIAYDAKDCLEHAGVDSLLKDLGALLHRSWELKRKLASSISNDHIDSLYEKGLRAGAFGGKIIGAGGGGFLMFLVPQERRDNIKEALYPLIELPVRFESDGSRIIYHL